MKFLVWTFAALTLILSVSLASAQPQRDTQRPREQKPAITRPAEAPLEPPQGEVETVKIDTNLVCP